MPALRVSVSVSAWDRLSEGAPVVADHTVVIETQRRGEHGAGEQLDVVFGEQREDLCLRSGGAAAAGQAVDGAAFAGGLGVGARVIELLLAPFAAQGQGLVAPGVQWQVQLAVGGQVTQGRGVEVGAAEDAFGTTGQPFVDPLVTGLFVLQEGHAAAEVPVAPVGEGEVFAVQDVGLLAQHALDVGIGVGVLGIAGVDVALAAEARFQLQGLLGRQAPAEQAVDVLVAYPLSAGGQGADLVAATLGFMAGIDIPVVRVGLGDIAVHAVAQGIGERPVEAEAHPLGGAFVTVLGEVLVHGHVAVGLAGGLLGDDVDHPAHGAGAVAGGSRAADHFDALDLVGGHPVGVAT